MPTSYQDIDTRLRVVEEKLDFVMSVLARPVPSAIAGAPPRVLTLKQLYEEQKQIAALQDAPPISNVRERVSLAEKAA